MRVFGILGVRRVGASSRCLVSGMASILRPGTRYTYDTGIRELVVKALMLRIEECPNESDPQAQERHEISTGARENPGKPRRVLAATDYLQIRNHHADGLA